MAELVHIHIDQTKYDSPNPTTGSALYTLGQVPAEQDLYRIENGKPESEPIEHGPEPVQLKNGDHFQTEARKTYTLYVNGEEKTGTTKWVTFDQMVAIAFPNPPTGQNMLYTISYEDGPNANSAGTLMEGGLVKVKDGMIFNVTPTDRS